MIKKSTPLTKEQKDQICELYKQNYSSTEIGKLLNKSPRTILSVLKARNIKRSSERRRSINDLTGKKFGKLTVLRRGQNLKKGKNIVTWDCVCDCGKQKTITRTNLIAGHVKSCGCLAKLERGEAAFNRLFGHYKTGARLRKYSFELSVEQFKKLINEECYYCGIVSSTYAKPAKGNNGGFYYNGVDRKNNKEGYTLDNSVACCFMCNYSKKDKDLQFFYEWVIRLHLNLKKTGQI